MNTMPQGKGQGSILPLANNRDTGQPFNKIAINLVKECETSTSGKKHFLTIIDHLTGWPEALPYWTSQQIP